MAKRRAEDSLLLQHDSPSKRCCSSLCSVVPTGGVSPPSLLALLGSRSRKRPYYFEEQQQQQQPEEEEAAGAAAAALYRKATHAANVVTVQTSGSFQDRRGSKKRPREDSTVSETVTPKDDDKADEDANTEDCKYNSFQFWRPLLPDLDLSLLEDAADHSQTKHKSKVSSASDAMET